jgi:hypothetical protein
MGAQNLTLKPMADQFRHPPDVVDVGVGEEKKVDLPGGNWPGRDGRNVVTALGKAAVDQNVQTMGLQQVAGAGNGVLSAEVSEVHFFLLG